MPSVSTADEHDMFNHLCSDVRAWLRRKTEALRFSKAWRDERLCLTTCTR